MVTALPSNADKALFVCLVGEGTTPSSPTTDAQLRAWISSLHVPFTTARDVDTSFTIRSTYGIKETTYIVDRTTMKILAKAKTPEAGLTALAGLP